MSISSYANNKNRTETRSMGEGGAVPSISFPPPPPPAASPVYIMSWSNGKCLAIENIEIFFGEEVSTLWQGV